MRKSLKHFVAGALAGVMCITSTLSAFAATPTLGSYKDGGTGWLVVNFLRGTSGSSWEGYSFANSGLPGCAGIKAGNFVKMTYLMDESKKSGGAPGSTTDGQIAYCIEPEGAINAGSYSTPPTGFAVTERSDIKPYAGSRTLDDQQVLGVRYILTNGYVGKKLLKWEPNKNHDNNLEWLEVDKPQNDPSYAAPLDSALNFYTPVGGVISTAEYEKAAWMSRVATQIALWTVVCGWYTDASTTSKAIDVFLNSGSLGHKSLAETEGASVAAQIKSIATTLVTGARGATAETADPSSASIFGKTYKAYNANPEEPVKLNISYASIKDIVEESEATKNKFRKTIEDALEKQGITNPQVRVDKNKSWFVITIPPKTKLEKFEVVFPFVKSGGLYTVFALDGGSQQNAVVPTVGASFFIEADYKTPDLTIIKKVNGMLLSETGGYDWGDFEFAVGCYDDDDNVIYFKFEYSSTGETAGFYAANGEYRTTGHIGSPLMLGTDDMIKLNLDNIPDNYKNESRYHFFIEETRAPEGMDNTGMVEFKLNDGNVVFDNVGDGTGLLLFYKKFFLEDGTECLPDDTDPTRKQIFDIGATRARFQVVKGSGEGEVIMSANATGTAGVYACNEEGEGDTTEFALDPLTGRLVIDNLPTGAYKIREITPSGRFDGEGWQFDYNSLDKIDDFTVTATVLPLNPNVTIEERIDAVIAKGYAASMNNVWIDVLGNLLILKSSDNGIVDGFSFTIASERDDDAKSFSFTETTQSGNVTIDGVRQYLEGYISLIDLPAYYSDGTPITVVITENQGAGISAMFQEFLPITGVVIEPGATTILTAAEGIVNYTKTCDLIAFKESEDGVVEGITFTIEALDPTENVLATFSMTTDSAGRAECLGLPVFGLDGNNNLYKINYRVTEDIPVRYAETVDNAPKDTVLDPDNIGATETQVLFVNTLKKTGYYLTKWADDFEVEGLTFVMSDATGKYYKEAQANAAGLVLFEDMVIYDTDNSKIKYTITEIDTPDRYFTPQALVDVELYELDETMTINPNRGAIENKSKKAAFGIIKTDEADQPLAGAMFTLFKADEYDEFGTEADAVAYGFTDDDGKLLFDDLAINREYIVVETAPPYGYAPIDPYRFTITEADEDTSLPEDAGYNYIQVVNCVDIGAVTLKVKKVDDTTYTPLAGAIFELTDASNKSYGRKATGMDGTLEFKNLPDGTYTLTEVAAPNGYSIVGEAAQEIEIVAADITPDEETLERVYDVTVENTAGEGGVNIYKVDANSGQPLAGAVFALYSADDLDNPIDTKSTNINGLASFGELDPGDYVIRESKAPTNYKLLEEDIELTIEDGSDETYSIVVENAPNDDIPLYVVKVDSSTNEPLEGAIFVIYNEENYPIARGASDENGIVTFDKKLNLDTLYYVREYQAPKIGDTNKYYSKQPYGLALILSENEATDETIISMYPENKQANLSDMLPGSGVFDEIHRVGDDDEMPAQAEALGTLVEYLTNEDEAVSITYANYDDGKIFGIRMENSTTITEYGSLKIVKTSTDDVIEGFQFYVIDEDGNTYSDITDEDGIIVFSNLPATKADGEPIKYTVRERITDGYIALPDINDVILEAGAITQVGVRNIAGDVGNIRIIKSAENGEIEGHVFYAEAYVNGVATGDVYQADPTDEDGIAIFHNLPIMTEDEDVISYLVGEIPEEGWVELLPVTIEQLYPNETRDLEFTNTQIDSEIRLIKVDGDNEALAGAEFGLYKDANGTQLVATKTSAIDNDEESATYGKAVVKFDTGLSTSTTYYLIELEAPEGYVASGDIYECIIDEEGNTTYKVYGTDAAPSATFPVCQNVTPDETEEARIIKTDDNNERLEGAVFGLYSDLACTDRLAQDTSTVDNDAASATYGKAVVKFDVERNNTYYIKEISAPEGYTASTTVYMATVAGDGTVKYNIVGTEGEFTTFPVCKNYANVENSVRLVKIDSEDRNLEGAKFGLYTDEGCTDMVASAFTKIDNDATSPTYNRAVVKFNAERDTTYYFKEISAPDGYTKSDAVFKAVVDADGDVRYSVVAGTSSNGDARVETFGDIDFPVCKNTKVVVTTTTPPPPPPTTTPPTTNPPTTTPPTTTTTTTKTTVPPPEITTTTTTPPQSEDTVQDSSTPKRTAPIDEEFPDDTTPKRTLDIEEDDDVPDTGVALNVTGAVALAVISGVLCTICLVNGFKKRKEEALEILEELSSDDEQ